MDDWESTRDHVSLEGALEARESAVGNTPGAPTWPIPDTGQATPIPRAGLNWATVAERLEVDLKVLLHDGSIVLPGEYFPEAGFAIDPVTFAVQRVDVGQMALRPVYFLGQLTLSEFGVSFAAERATLSIAHPIIWPGAGAVSGLFGDERGARRAHRALLKGSLGSGVRIHVGPLGTELHVGNPELPGRVASTIARCGGAVIGLDPGSGALATGRPGGWGDAVRPGTGAASDSPGSEPETTAGALG